MNRAPYNRKHNRYKKYRQYKGAGLMYELMAAGNAAIQAQDLGAELYGRFIAYLDKKPKTIETYRQALKPFFLYMAREGINRPTREDVLNYRNELRESCKAATIQAYMLSVRLFFRWLAQEGLYPNVADNVKGATVDRDHKKGYLTSGQVRETLQGIDREDIAGKRDYAMFLLMATAGLRTIEVIRANVEDIPTAEGRAVLYVQGKGKEDKAQYVKLAGPVEEAIRAYLKARGPVEASAPLFASNSRNNQGGRMTTRAIRGMVKAYMAQAGLASDRLTAHSLRHTAGTLNLLNGGTLQETQQLLRHKDIGTTMIYVHNMTRETNNSEDRIARAIFGA